MNRLTSKLQKSLRRQNRVRSVVRGTTERPRLSVFVSNQHVTAQLIDDTKHLTIGSYSTAGKKSTGTMTERAAVVGTEIAKIAKSKKVKQVVFDRGSRIYHGRVKALADAARKEGLDF